MQIPIDLTQSKSHQRFIIQAYLLLLSIFFSFFIFSVNKWETSMELADINIRDYISKNSGMIQKHEIEISVLQTKHIEVTERLIRIENKLDKILKIKD